jgi:hypothetical protein
VSAANKTPSAENRQHVTWSEILGWYGMLAIIGAYFLVSFELVVADSVLYQSLNFTGAVGLLWIAFRKRVTQVVVLNTFWALIALLALGNLFIK